MEFVILSVFLLSVYAGPPAAWGLRIWAGTVAGLVWGQAFWAELPTDAHVPLDGFVAASLIWFFILASLGVGGRVFWALATESSLELSPPAKSMLYRTDCLIATLFGLVAGTVATLHLAVHLRGAAGGLALHIAIAAVATAAAMVSLRLRGRLRPLVVATLATVACLTLAGGTLYPRLILADAKVILPDAPRCLRTPEGTAPTTDQLRLLTLPLAQPRRPNLVLTVMTDNGPRDFRWSYRSSAFRSYGSYDGGPCPI